MGEVHDLTAVSLVVSSEQKKPRRPRKPSVGTLIRRAEKQGKNVISITMPDGTVLHFGEPEPVSKNPWDEVLSREPH